MGGVLSDSVTRHPTFQEPQLSREYAHISNACFIRSVLMSTFLHISHCIVMKIEHDTDKNMSKNY